MGKNAVKERKNAIQPADKSGNRPVRYATAEQFKNAHAKTSKVHAELFRRLAKE